MSFLGEERFHLVRKYPAVDVLLRPESVDRDDLVVLGRPSSLRDLEQAAGTARRA